MQLLLFSYLMHVILQVKNMLNYVSYKIYDKYHLDLLMVAILFANV
jgi:hypothetical protein